MVLQFLDTIIAFVVIMLGISLLITVLNQMISALLGSRGMNLLWGLKTLLGTIDPGLEAKAEGLAREFLETPLVSDSLFSKFPADSPLGRLTRRWRLASAVSAEDLAKGLGRMADALKDKDAPMAAKITALLGAPNPETVRRVQLIQEVAASLGPNVVPQIDNAVRQLGAGVQASIGRLEAGFDAVMKRASQRFALQMRIWTVIFAAVICFGLRLDSVGLVQRLWADPVARSNLVAKSETIDKEASVLLGDGSVPSGGDEAVRTESDIAPQILAEAMAKLKQEPGFKIEARDIPPFVNLKAATEWLGKNLAGEQALRAKLMNDYQLFAFEGLRAHAEAIRKDLTTSAFRIQMPSSGQTLKEYYAGFSILGILASIALLSLGAPFWFTALKTLSSLRPLVASEDKPSQASST